MKFSKDDKVVLSVPWQMTGLGDLPSYKNGKDSMTVIKKCKSGLYECEVPGQKQTASVKQDWLSKEVAE